MFIWPEEDDFVCTVYENSLGYPLPITEYFSIGIKDIREKYKDVNMTSLAVMFVDYNGMPGFHEAVT
jgi:hypothetical protein